MIMEEKYEEDHGPQTTDHKSVGNRQMKMQHYQTANRKP